MWVLSEVVQRSELKKFTLLRFSFGLSSRVELITNEARAQHVQRRQEPHGDREMSRMRLRSIPNKEESALVDPAGPRNTSCLWS